MKEFRIAAAAIVIREDKVLLVRYHNPHGKSFLVGPGGGVDVEENLQKALIREVREETGLEVKPGKILFIDDLLSSRYRMLKIWFLCDFIGGELLKTKEAQTEGITEVNWYEKDQLKDEIVYPTILTNVDWKEFSKESWQAYCPELLKASF